MYMAPFRPKSSYRLGSPALDPGERNPRPDLKPNSQEIDARQGAAEPRTDSGMAHRWARRVEAEVWPAAAPHHGPC